MCNILNVRKLLKQLIGTQMITYTPICVLRQGSELSHLKCTLQVEQIRNLAA